MTGAARILWASRRGSRSVVPALLAGLLVCSCSSAPPETAVLGQFFRALAQGDRTTASGLSMVSFPGGPVVSWEVLEIGPAAEGPYRAPELREEEVEAEARRDEQFKIFYDFRQGNRDAVEAIADRRTRNPDAVIAGRLGEIAAELDAHQADRRRVVSALSEVQMALDEERRRAARSLLREAPVDYLTGSITEKEVLVRVEEEGAGARGYRFILLRYDLENQFGNAVPSRWIIAAIESADEP